MPSPAPEDPGPVDAGRRRLLRLAALSAATFAGAAYLLVDRLRGGGSPSVRASSSGGSTSPGTSTTTPGTTTEPAPAPSATGSPATTPTTAAPVRTAAAGVMLCREAWGAAAPTRTMPPHEVAGLMVHHTAVLLDDNRKSPDRIRGHQRFHQSRGFADIAYHVFVDAHGNVFEGRDPAQPGETFTDYDPTGWFLVVCEGNFDEQPLPEAQRDAMARVLAWAGRRYGIEPETVVSHRQHAHTRCPGDAIHALVLDGTLGRLVRQAGTVELDELCGPEAEARVAAIRAGTL